MTMLTAPVDLGQGHSVAWVWREEASREHGIPAGLIERHGSCRLYVTWAPSDGCDDGETVFRLVSLQPLHVEPAVVCPLCGATGAIRDGKWVPSDA